MTLNIFSINNSMEGKRGKRAHDYRENSKTEKQRRCGTFPVAFWTIGLRDI